MLKPIPGYENYLINESGIIVNSQTHLMERISVDNNGFMYIYLGKDIVYIHEIMARLFLDQSSKEKKPYIIHKDSDPMNNHVSNLEYSDCMDEVELVSREHRQYSGSKNLYEVYNEDTGDYTICTGRGEVAKLIQYEEISLKNMVGNGRKISLGPYKGYQIRRFFE